MRFFTRPYRHPAMVAIGLLCLGVQAQAAPDIPEEPMQVLQGPPGHLTQAGRDFIQKAAHYHEEEIRAAREATNDSMPRDVREYAQRLVYDNRAALGKLRLVAAMQGIEIPKVGSGSAESGSGALEPAKAETSTETKKLQQADASPAGADRETTKDTAKAAAKGKDSAASSDASVSHASAGAVKQFLSERAAHQEAGLKLFDKDQPEIQAPNIESYLEATRPLIAEHLKIARRILEEEKTDGRLSAMTEVERGRYLVRAGDCVACHTRPGGKPFEGGRALKTPYGGVIYTPNLTPSKEGIGDFSDADFIQALHEGIDPDGKPYYPAFPYPSFTHVRKKDLLAIRAYLATLKPSHYRPPANDLPWPLGIRDVLYTWQDLFFKPGYFKPNPDKSKDWNRGAYLVKGLGHCGACHTPRNIASAKETDKALAGARRDGWFAPNLTSDLHDGIGRWSVQDLVTAMRTGMTEDPDKKKAGPSAALVGPMAEVVHRSLSYLFEDDLRAIAVYLKDLPPIHSEAPQPRTAANMEDDALELGADIYRGRCAACHGDDGRGHSPYVPALRGNPILRHTRPNDLVMSILAGGPAKAAQAYSPYVLMPAFDDMLSNDEVAAVASYLRDRWGDDAVQDDAISVGRVAQLRKEAASAN